MKQTRKNNMRYLSTLHNDILGFFFFIKDLEGKVKKFHITVKCSKEVIK